MKKVTKNFMIIIAVVISYSYTANAQVGINSDGTEPDGSVLLNVKSSDKSQLPPRVDNVDDVSKPVAGLQVYDQNAYGMHYYGGTIWSEHMERSFACEDALIDPRDGQSYATVQIGTQCWMAENLAYLPSVVGVGTSSETDPYYYVYGYQGTDVAAAKAEPNYDTYGVLYNWPAATAACPTDWHLPSDEEWTTLTTELGGTESNAGSKMAGNAALWSNGLMENDLEFDTSGLAILPGGYGGTDGSFLDQGYYASFWSSTESGSNANYLSLIYNPTGVYRSYHHKTFSFSVRCVRD